MILIVCPQCAASYQVSPASLGADGRSVRCVNCQTIWFATAPEPALEMVAAVDPQMAAADPGQDMSADAGAYPAPETNAFDIPPPGSDGIAPGIPGDNIDAAAVPVIDQAEPAMMGDSPSIVPPIEDASVPTRAAFALPGEDIESLAARRQAELDRRRWRLRVPSLATGIVLLGGIVLVLVSARNLVVQYAPQTASFYAAIGLPVNLRGLDFENIRVTRDVHEGVPVMVVEGKIVSTNKGIVEVPRLRFAIHDATGREIYTWTMMPSRTLLAGGETLPFRSRLASPPVEGKDVSLRFFNRRDVMTGFR